MKERNDTRLKLEQFAEAASLPPRSHIHPADDLELAATSDQARLVPGQLRAALRVYPG